MIIDINKLKQQGKTEQDFTLYFTPDRNLLDIPNSEIVGEVRVDVNVSVSSREAYAEGKATFTIKGECSRCLEEANVEVVVGFDAQFGMTHDAEYFIKAGQIDLTASVEQAIIMDAPLVIYCKEDCQGVCCNCGANLNQSKCNCKN